MFARLHTWWIALPLGAVTAGVIVFLTSAIASGAASCGGYKELLVETINRCPRARSLLGDDIGPAMVGVACGSTKTDRGSGWANWRMPFAGSRARGELDYNLELHAGRWSMLRGVLSVDDERIDLVACLATAEAPSAPPAAAPVPAESPSSLVDTTVTRCDGGDAAACLSAGAMFESGHLVLVDLARARALYHRACAAGSAPGCRLEASLANKGFP